MLETYNTLVLQSLRNLKKNMTTAPVLYLIFIIMIVFSTLFLGVISLVLIENDLFINLDTLLFLIIFLFIIKSSHDFYQHFTKSEYLTYALSSPISQKKTIFEVFLMNFWFQLGIWVLFSTLYTVSILLLRLPVGVSFLYLTFTVGVMLATVLGTLIVLHYFSQYKYRLIPVGGMLCLLYFFPSLVSILLLLGVSLIYLYISLFFALDSYQFVKRKTWKQERTQLWLTHPILAVFYKEVIILWREKILFSILFSAVVLGIGIGYIARFGITQFLPENLAKFAEGIPPETYAFFGIYILTIHAAVFVSLSFFLNEEKTLWLLRHMPIHMMKIVSGKALTISMPFLCSIPFIAYFTAFIPGQSLLFIIWFLLFSFIASMILCFPLGARYAGRKSDILLLYSVSLMIFIILSIMYSLSSTITSMGIFGLVVYMLLVLLEITFFVFVSMKQTAKYLSIQYTN